jgi:ribosomal protein S12 methylthiotransferase
MDYLVQSGINTKLGSDMNNQDKTALSFVSLGCFKNLVDTEVLGGMLEKRNIKLVSPYEDSEWIAVNTCGFIRDAKVESIDEILAALEKKEQGEIKHVAVFGCLTQRYYDELKENFKEADIIWGVNDLEELADHIAKTEKEKKKKKMPPYEDKELFLYNHKHKRIMTSTPNVAFIKISEGCNMKCSFCSIPQIRGAFRSRTIESIVKEAESYKKAGISELNLVSQNSTYFGKDRGNRSQLPDLLEALSKIGFQGIRVLYLMPEEVNDEIIGAFAYPTVIPYFDLPFQHVSPAVLSGMNRSGDSEKNQKMIGHIREKYKDAVIRTSFIVGFPGETEADFEELVRFAKASRIERIGVFSYSDEENTEAFDLEDKVEPYLIEDRKEKLMDVSDGNIESYNQELVDREAVAGFLPLGPCPWDDQSTIGRILAQAPDSDGLTQSNVPFDDKYDMYHIKITGFQNELLYGEKV